MKVEVAEVSRPLASVRRICEAGHVVVFDEDCGFLFSKMTGGGTSAERGVRQLHVRCVDSSYTYHDKFSQAVTIGYP